MIVGNKENPKKNPEIQHNEHDVMEDNEVIIFDENHESSNKHSEFQNYDFPIPAPIFYQRDTVIITHEFPRQGHLKKDEFEIFIYNNGNTMLDLLNAEMKLLVNNNEQKIISGGFEKYTFYSREQLDKVVFGTSFAGKIQIEPEHKTKLHWHYGVGKEGQNSAVQIYLKIKIGDQIEEIDEELTRPKNSVNFKNLNTNSNHEESSHDNLQEIQAPNNLNLPFGIEDIDISRKLLSPFGLIRHSKDSGTGHGGIDIPLNVGDEIFAPADGTIIENIPASDGQGGNNVRIEISKGERDGEAWAFLFEHITLQNELMVGVNVDKGQLISHSTIVQGANHLALEYLFNNLKYTKNHKCWIEFLNPIDRNAFEDEFKKLKSQTNFLDSWKYANEEGYYSYQIALDKSKYPDGPRYCYSMGHISELNKLKN